MYPAANAAALLLVGMLFVPLYLVTGAWDAGFGIQGWHTLATNPHLAHSALARRLASRRLGPRPGRRAVGCADRRRESPRGRSGNRGRCRHVRDAAKGHVVRLDSPRRACDRAGRRLGGDHDDNRNLRHRFLPSPHVRRRSLHASRARNVRCQRGSQGVELQSVYPPSASGAACCYRPLLHSRPSPPRAACSPILPMHDVDRPGYGDSKIGVGPLRCCSGSAMLCWPAFRSATCCTKPASKSTAAAAGHGSNAGRRSNVVERLACRAARFPRRTLAVDENRRSRRHRRTCNRIATGVEHAPFASQNTRLTVGSARALAPTPRHFTLPDDSRPAARRHHHSRAEPPARLAIRRPRLAIRLQLRALARSNAARHSHSRRLSCGPHWPACHR